MSGKVEKVAEALMGCFRDVVAGHAGMPFEQTKVELPNKDVWLRYASAAVQAYERDGE